MGMTPRGRVEAALRGERPDRVPFTIYDSLLPRGEAERRLREGGACVISTAVPAFRSAIPRSSTDRFTCRESGIDYVRTVVKTEKGEISSLERLAPDGGSSWMVEWPFKGPGDYGTLEWMFREEAPLPNYEAFAEAQATWGGDGFLLVNIGPPPMQHLMDVTMGLEGFAREWAERQDEVMKLYDAIAESRRKVYRTVAESPALAANYGANVSAEVVGLDRFRRYFIPHYEEFAAVMHDRRKLVGVHFDANTWLLSEAIGQSTLDYVEAFTPRPDCDMTVAEARVAWRGKSLWANFPTSVHASDLGEVEAVARQILFEAAPGDRFLMGITEAIPRHRWQESVATIARITREMGGL